MTSISDGESGSSVRSKLNSSLAVTDAFTVSGANVGIGVTPTSRLNVNGGNVSNGFVVNGTTKAVRIGASTTYGSIEGVDQTGLASFQPLLVGGLELIFNTGVSERMRINTSGNVGIGTASPNAASIVDAQSTTKGVRFPNMTTTQKNAITNVAGNVVFDTTLGKLCVNTGSGWQTITSV